jgi:hypothetical protein
MGIFAFYFVPAREEIRIPAAINPEWAQWVDSISVELTK